MFAVFRIVPAEPTKEQVELFGKIEFYRLQAQRFYTTANNLLVLYAAHRPEYHRVDQAENAQFPDGSYNYWRESITIRAFLLAKNDTLFGVRCKKGQIAIFVNLDLMPDNRYLDQLEYLFGVPPVIHHWALEWDKTKPQEPEEPSVASP